MLTKTVLSAAVALGLSGAAGQALASGGEAHITDFAFSFEGPFGVFDQAQLQRGLQVYTEVCSNCHGLRYVPFRSLAEEGGPGYPEDDVRSYAANFTVIDEETGEEREALLTDHFPPSALPEAPDLSVMAKARAGFEGPYGTGLSQLFNGRGGAEYIASLLTGFTGEEKEQADITLYENHAFASGFLSMAPPLFGDDVEYEDGTEATLEQEAQDVAAFLMWTAEPKLAARKHAGLTAILMLVILSALLYLTNKRLWAPIKHREEKA